VAENQYRRLGYPESILHSQLSELDTNEYICFRAIDEGICLETRSGSSGSSPCRPRVRAAGGDACAACPSSRRARSSPSRTSPMRCAGSRS
jgi:hypothetical protein